MTFARREEILSKDILTIADVQELNGMTYQPAAELIRNIKRVMNSQYNVAGRIATNDYIKFFDGQTPTDEIKPVRHEAIKQQRKVAVYETPLFRAKEFAAK